MATYTAYETDEGLCLETVETYCKHITDMGSFNDETQPTGQEVEKFLTASYYSLAGILTSVGYSIVQTEDAVLAFLQEVQALDVVVKVELANPITGLGEPNERFKEFKARYTEMIELIKGTQLLEGLGAAVAEQGSASQLLAISGISKSRKRSVEDDSDYVQSRFRRGQGRNPLNDDTHADTDWHDEND